MFDAFYSFHERADALGDGRLDSQRDQHCFVGTQSGCNVGFSCVEYVFMLLLCIACLLNILSVAGFFLML
jgi:hypothetical protein